MNTNELYTYYNNAFDLPEDEKARMAWKQLLFIVNSTGVLFIYL
jgi:hypothetical protein